MYTSPSPLPRRDPLRLPFSVHIRKLFFLFLFLFSGAPRRTHPVGAGVPDGPHRFSFMPTAGIFRAPMDAPVGAGVPDGPHRRTFEYRCTLVYPSVGAGAPDGPHRRTFEYRRTLVYPSVGAGVPDGPFSVLRLRVAPASCICLRRPYFFQQRKKYGKERRQKPTVFGFPFSDCNCIIKRSHNESPVLLSPLPLPRAAG